ncbi:hypothetical protein TraAM80_04395 [Trypanosoma rangeli]|uniref:Uncharacterized protein n=1 Tax=Trypanosoma rangeli TaxID=5698 RepID=A0A422NJR0_TRYRA|nr:uncharacterized protein TraAM80_04395 [Trypanosoma rangeli]RNF05674.1 hypothetical protein TraAM80_04395 [Trypanosoma rangeli]|eukprot:RNF05674.1 hypothetical protein TraAM80_04395 [Trypanosoma rangeli]
MGGVPSRDASSTFFTLCYGAHEVGLIPLVHPYFRKESKELRGQFVRMRNDPSVRYNYMRGAEYNMKQLPPASYTEENLDKLLDVIDATLYDTAKNMLEDEDTPLRPVPCAVCFVYVNDREGTDCFSFCGRRINIIGHFGCHKYEDREDDEPCLYLQKAILKAAGDRTLERVVTLAAMMLKEEFFRAAASVHRGAEAMELFSRRISHLSLIVRTPWNSYPVLRLVYDTAAVAWSVEKVQEYHDAPRFSSYEVPESGESGLMMQIEGSLLHRFILRACLTVIPLAVRGMWGQFILNDTATQNKEQVMTNWLNTSPEVNYFLGGTEFTSRVKKHLENLLREVVRARETPTSDLSVWSAEQECSHDGKIYRIFDSPLCGPFLATVKVKQYRSHATSSGHRRSRQALEQALDSGVAVKSGGSVSSLKYPGHPNVGAQAPTTRPLPECDEAANSTISSVFMSTGSPVICPMTLPVSALPPWTNSLASTHRSSVVMLQQPLSSTSEVFPLSAMSTSVGSGFLPFYQESPKATALPIQSFGMPYVVLTNSDSAAPHQNMMPVTPSVTTMMRTIDHNNGNDISGSGGNIVAKGGGATFINIVNGTTELQPAYMQSVGNYFLVTDSRVELVRPVPVTSAGHWSP